MSIKSFKPVEPKPLGPSRPVKPCHLLGAALGNRAAVALLCHRDINPDPFWSSERIGFVAQLLGYNYDETLDSHEQPWLEPISPPVTTTSDQSGTMTNDDLVKAAESVGLSQGERSPFHFYLHQVERRQPVQQIEPVVLQGSSLSDGYEPESNLDLWRPSFSWLELWPTFQALLHHCQRSKQFDALRYNRRLARDRFSTSLPMKKRERYVGSHQVWLDISRTLLPMKRDLFYIAKSLIHYVGKESVEIYLLYGAQCEHIEQLHPKRHRDRLNWRQLIKRGGRAPLIISDLGQLDPSGEQESAWISFGHALKRFGFTPPTVLSPVKQGSTFDRYFNLRPLGKQFDAAHNMKDAMKVAMRGRSADSDSTPYIRLKSALSMTSMVDFSVLRQLRVQIPGATLADEIQLANDPDISGNHSQLYFRPDCAEPYRELYRRVPESLRNTLDDIIHRFHRTLPFTLNQEKSLLFDALNDEGEKSEQFLQWVRAHLELGVGGDQALFLSWVRGLCGFIPESLRRHSDVVALYSLAFREEIERGKILPLRGYDERAVANYLRLPQRKAVSYFLYETDTHFFISSDDPERPNIERKVLTFDCAYSRVKIELIYQQGLENRGRNKNRSFEVAVDDLNLLLRDIGKSFDLFRLYCDQYCYTVRTIPSVIDDLKVNCDELGAYIHYLDAGKQKSARWFNPGLYPVRDRTGEVVGELLVTKGFYCDVEAFALWKHEGFQQPEWSDRIVCRDGAVWAEIKFGQGGTHHSAQRVRLILPGELDICYDLGDLSFEARERASCKRLVTRAFWLAESPVSRSNWLEIMARNPRYFGPSNAPVDNVSWNDCARFVDRLNLKYPGINFRLPTETEWELGISALLAHGLVNTKRGDKRGKADQREQRERSGNRRNALVRLGAPHLFEWCSDRYGSRNDRGVAINPSGAFRGRERVLRHLSIDTSNDSSDDLTGVYSQRTKMFQSTCRGHVGFRLVHDY